jgi:ABC-2 type transport system ATP-binding protein
VTWRDASGALHERQTDDPTRLLHELTSEALARGERLDELSVSRPSLEDVYLELTAEAEVAASEAVMSAPAVADPAGAVQGREAE